MDGFAVTCPLAPDAPRLLSGFCSSPRSFGFGFFQTPPRGDALAVSLAFGSAKTWLSDLHRHSYVPCPAHTFGISGDAKRRPCMPLLGARFLLLFGAPGIALAGYAFEPTATSPRTMLNLRVVMHSSNACRPSSRGARGTSRPPRAPRPRSASQKCRSSG